MDTGRKPICSFILRIFTICLTIFTLGGVDAYAVDDSDNKYIVISPYWQSDSSSYTFIAVTHPSLSNMASQIGVQLNAIQSDTTAFGTAASFTISAGVTERVFIVRTGHSIINSTIIPSGQFIVGTTNYAYGNIIVRPIASHPFVSRQIQTLEDNSTKLYFYPDITMLSYFGGIVFDSNTTGFAMEFIGDVHDSTTTYDWNQHVTSGVN